LTTFTNKTKTPIINQNLKYYDFHGEIIVAYGARRSGKSTLIKDLANYHKETMFLGGINPDWKDIVNGANNVKAFIGSDFRNYIKLSGSPRSTILLADDPTDISSHLSNLKQAITYINMLGGKTYITTSTPAVLHYIARIYAPGTSSITVEKYLEQRKVESREAIIGFLYPEFLEDLEGMNEEEDKKANSVTPICANCKNYLFLELSCKLDRDKHNLSSKATCPKFDSA